MNLKSQRNLPAKNPTSPQTNSSINKEFEIGCKVEHEHTQDDALAAKIAMDHLSEDPSYYSKLMRAGLVDEPSALEMTSQSGNTAPHVPTSPLVPAPRVNVDGTFVNKTTGATLPHFIDAEKKTKPFGQGDGLEHFCGKIEKEIGMVAPMLAALGNGIHEGGSTITEPAAGITSDQHGKRWSIDAYPSDKKVTPKLK